MRRSHHPLAAVAALAAAVALGACGGPAGASGGQSGTGNSAGASGSSTGASGSTTGGGIGALHRSGTASLSVLSVKGQTEAVVPVTIDGKGPYPFIVDTGSAKSVVYQPVAKAAGLRTDGNSEQVSGVGCRTKAHEAQVSSWRAGSTALPADQVLVLHQPAAHRGTTFGGLLGSDVLSRFGEVVLDYATQQLRLGPGATHFSGPKTTRTRIRVVHHDGAVLAVAPVHVDGHGPYPFVVDTGAAGSVITSSTAAKLGLPVVSGGHQATGVSCTTATKRVRLRHWRVGSISLPGTKLTSLSFPGPQSPSIDGLLGSGTLERFGKVAIDYSHHELLLAPRREVPSGGTVTLSVRHEGGTHAVVPVTIDGKGPYRFALDTGASISAISRSLATSLGLHATGHHVNVQGVVSGRQAGTVRISHWSAGTVALPADTLAELRLSKGPSSRQAVQGLLGSDVLRHFVRVTVGYHAGRLALGKAATPPTGARTARLEVLSEHGATTILAPVTLNGHGPFGFTLDTGASRSVVARSVARRAGLRPNGGKAAVGGVVAAAAAPTVTLSSWSVASVSLPRTDAVALSLSKTSAGREQGLLGSDVLSHFGTVTINYRKDLLYLPRG